MNGGENTYWIVTTKLVCNDEDISLCVLRTEGAFGKELSKEPNHL
jgi:hypothetical protein